MVVIGAGTAGLVTAAGAAGLGARVALIEKELMGGDCLNVGCVPSKALISAARVAATVKNAREFGVHVPDGSHTDFAEMMQRMRRLRASISPVDSAKRFTEMGVDIFFGEGQFVSDRCVQVTAADGSTRELIYKKSVIASGARASAPPIDGIDSVDYLTNETLFSLTELPPRLGIVGSGPIGSEMAQAFARFGSEVFLYERGDRILGREDAQGEKNIQDQFIKDGVQLLLNSSDMKLAATDKKKISVTVNQAGKQNQKTVDQLLIAVGRAPNVESLNLQSVGVKFSKQGVEVNDYLQTTNPKIFRCRRRLFSTEIHPRCRLPSENRNSKFPLCHRTTRA